MTEPFLKAIYNSIQSLSNIFDRTVFDFPLIVPSSLLTRSSKYGNRLTDEHETVTSTSGVRREKGEHKGHKAIYLDSNQNTGAH